MVCSEQSADQVGFVLAKASKVLEGNSKGYGDLRGVRKQRLWFFTQSVCSLYLFVHAMARIYCRSLSLVASWSLSLSFCGGWFLTRRLEMTLDRCGAVKH